MKVTSDFLKKLSKFSLFANASAGAIKLALSADDCEIKVFNSGEVMFGPETNSGYLAVILRGKGELFSADPTKDVLLKTLSIGDTLAVTSSLTRIPLSRQESFPREAHVCSLSPNHLLRRCSRTIKI